MRDRATHLALVGQVENHGRIVYGLGAHKPGAVPPPPRNAEPEPCEFTPGTVALLIIGGVGLGIVGGNIALYLFRVLEW